MLGPRPKLPTPRLPTAQLGGSAAAGGWRAGGVDGASVRRRRLAPPDQRRRRRRCSVPRANPAPRPPSGPAYPLLAPLQHAAELIANAKAIATPGKGILAADESTGTIGKRVRPC